MSDESKHAANPSEWDVIQDFLAGQRYAVVGASTNREKYGNKVLRAYQQAGRQVVAVNPRADQIEGVPSYASLAAIPGVAELDGVSIITPPKVTEQVVREAVEAGVKKLWMQPGAASEVAVAEAEAAGLVVLHDGPCVLVALGYRETE